MGEERLSRRRVLGVLAAGIGVGGAGCTGDDPASASTTSGTARSSTASTTATPTTTSSTTAATTATQTTSAGSEPSTTATTVGTASERGEYTVGMYTDLYFDPIGLFVEPGETVSFELVSGVHSAAAYHPDNEAALSRRVPEGAPAWDTGVFDSVGKFRNVTFETQGTHDYFCLPHKQLGMIGRIVVGEPGGPATESPNPDGDLPDSERIVEQGAIPYEEFQAGSR